MMASPVVPALLGRGLHKRFDIKGSAQPLRALDDVSLSVAPGTLTALVGPDGAGKTTLLRLAAGLMRPSEGRLHVLGIDVAADPQAVQERISYMPQRFGLYEDLSVQENLDLYADLHGVPADLRRQRYARLMEMTDLGRFAERLAGKLSGGMKQKLGLACTLVRSPELLLLDEPTVGVDPLSRRELWEIVHELVETEHLSVIVSTAYLDEAEGCAQVVVLHDGKILAQGLPGAISARADGLCHLVRAPAGVPARVLQSRLLDAPDLIIDAVPHAGAVRFVQAPGASASAVAALLDGAPTTAAPARLEDGFMMLLRERRAPSPVPAAAPLQRVTTEEEVIVVRDLVRMFGDFTAVASATFSVRRGEIFGLLGPNGAGQTTTFRMLCGLLPASSGQLLVAGVNLRYAPARARQRIAYVSQRFAMYGNLTVRENLEFFGGAYGLYGQRLRTRMQAVLEQFGLLALSDSVSGQLPGGYKQRLAMAAGLLHEPDILFLDEPTSGADPLARREFWRRITALAEAGVTVVITTHFMEEAEYCDRIVIQDAGKVLAIGTPEQVRGQSADGAASMEQAFIGIIERSRAEGRIA
jgi:ABC-2 type transport system ATP-binding protein